MRTHTYTSRAGQNAVAHLFKMIIFIFRLARGARTESCSPRGLVIVMAVVTRRSVYLCICMHLHTYNRSLTCPYRIQAVSPRMHIHIRKTACVGVYMHVRFSVWMYSRTHCAHAACVVNGNAHDMAAFQNPPTRYMRPARPRWCSTKCCAPADRPLLPARPLLSPYYWLTVHTHTHTHTHTRVKKKKKKKKKKIYTSVKKISRSLGYKIDDKTFQQSKMVLWLKNTEKWTKSSHW